jgi:hypothetical protein
MEGYYSSKKSINRVACTTKMKAAVSETFKTLENLPGVTAQNTKTLIYADMKTANFK